MKYQVYGRYQGVSVLIGWPRRSLKAALCFMQRCATPPQFSDLRIVGPKGREWRYKLEASDDA